MKKCSLLYSTTALLVLNTACYAHRYTSLFKAESTSYASLYSCILDTHIGNDKHCTAKEYLMKDETKQTEHEHLFQNPRSL